MHRGVHSTTTKGAGPEARRESLRRKGGDYAFMHYLGDIVPPGTEPLWEPAASRTFSCSPPLPPRALRCTGARCTDRCKVLTVSLSFLSRSSSRCRLPARSSAESACSCKLRIFLRTASSELLPAIARGAGCWGAPPLRMPPDEPRAPPAARSRRRGGPQRPEVAASGGAGEL